VSKIPCHATKQRADVSGVSALDCVLLDVITLYIYLYSLISYIYMLLHPKYMQNDVDT
jgi:hypothetical protein